MLKISHFGEGLREWEILVYDVVQSWQHMPHARAHPMPSSIPTGNINYSKGEASFLATHTRDFIQSAVPDPHDDAAFLIEFTLLAENMFCIFGQMFFAFISQTWVGNNFHCVLDAAAKIMFSSVQFGEMMNLSESLASVESVKPFREMGLRLASVDRQRPGTWLAIAEQSMGYVDPGEQCLAGADIWQGYKVLGKKLHTPGLLDEVWRKVFVVNILYNSIVTTPKVTPKKASLL